MRKKLTENNILTFLKRNNDANIEDVKTESKKQNNEATKYQLVILLIETSWHRDHFFEENKQRI